MSSSTKKEIKTDRISMLPRPLPDPAFYKSTLENGFRKFGLRHQNYIKYQKAKRCEELDYLPIKMDIENVSRCNYRCTMCQVSDWPELKRAVDMSFDEFKALIDSQYGLIEIKLQGMGEPLLGKTYSKMIKYARGKGIWVRSSTNASLLHVDDNYKQLIDSDICELQVSVDSVTPKTYKKIRRGGDLKRVMDNCILLNRYCHDVNLRRTRMWVVVQKENFTELKRFPAFAADLGFDRLTFSLDLNDWGQKKWRKLNDQVDVHKQFDFSLAKHLINLGKEQNVDVTFWFIDEKYSTRDINKLCPWPFERAYISCDMHIVPCCMISNPEVISLGNAKNFSEEWNGAWYREFRRKHISGHIPDYCRNCYER